MPLLFDISDAQTVIDKIESQNIRDLYHACGETADGELAIMRDLIIHVVKPEQLWMILKPVNGNWFCMNSNKTSNWIGASQVQGQFLTEIKSPDLHRFFPVLESVRRNERNIIVRHSNELDGEITFWDTLVIACKQHRLVEERHYVIISVKRDIGKLAIHDLFELSPIVQFVVLPLKDVRNLIYDVYILEANEQARRLFKNNDSSATGKRLREEIDEFADEDVWNGLLKACETNSEPSTTIGGVSFSMHIQKLNSYWVIHMFETGFTTLGGDLGG